MKIYVDLILLLNFFIDFSLLLSVSVLLKRNASFNRVLLGSFIGSLSILFLYIKISPLMLFLYKIIMCLVMCMVSFKVKSFSYTMKNFIYVYVLSFFLGGVLNYLNNEFAYKRVGFIYFHKGISINFIFILIVVPITLYFYIKQYRLLKNNYNNYYQVSFNFDNHNYKLTGYMDSGNKVRDPICKIPVIFIDKRKILFDINEFEMVLVPITTAIGSKLIKCFRPKDLSINDKKINRVYIGIMDDVIKMDGVDILLNTYLMEGLC